MMNLIKQSIATRLKGYRTLIVNLLLAAMPVLEMTEVLSVLPKGYEAPYAIFIALINLYLRTVTTTSMGKPQ